MYNELYLFYFFKGRLLPLPPAPRYPPGTRRGAFLRTGVVCPQHVPSEGCSAADPARRCRPAPPFFRRRRAETHAAKAAGAGLRCVTEGNIRSGRNREIRFGGYFILAAVFRMDIGSRTQFHTVLRFVRPFPSPRASFPASVHALDPSSESAFVPLGGKIGVSDGRHDCM